MAEYILTDQDFGVILKLFADATSVNIADAGGYFTGTEVETALQEIGLRASVARPLNGFEDRTQSALSWGGTRTLTLTPSSTDYYWVGGYRYSYSSPLTKQIDNTSGIWVFYFDAGDPTTLTAERNPSETNLDTIILDDCIVAIVYWNANTGTAVILADERHGVRMSAETHHYLHDTRGARFVSGGAISGYTLSTATDAAISFDLTDIRIYDEDLELDMVDGSAANQYEQVLTGDAEIPVLYRDDTDGSWVEQAASTLPYIINGTPQPTYMNDDGDGTWSQVELSNNKYMLYFLMATNDWQYPVKMIQGQAEYATASAARTAINTEISNWSGLPTPEWCLMYAFVMQQSAGNTKELVIIEILDYRFENIVGTTSSAAIDHGNTVGLLDDDHTQYLLIDGTRAMTGILILGTAETTTQSINMGVKAFDAGGVPGFIARETNNNTEMFMVAGSVPSIGSGTSSFYVYASGSFAMNVSSSTVTFYGNVGISLDLTVSGGDMYLKGGESNPANLFIYADQGDDNADKWSINANITDTLSIKSYSTGSWVEIMGFTGAGVVNLINTLCLNSVTDAYTSAHGIILDLAGADDLCALQMRDSTDVAHGMTSWCSTNTWGAIRKAGASGGGLKLEGYTDSDGTVGIYMQSFVGGTLDATKSTAGSGAVNIICGLISGTGLAATITADCNLLAVRKAESGPVYTTVFMVDEDGDTWQPGHVGLNTVKNSYESPIGLYMDIAGNDTPCMTFRDSTDIAHGMTGYTDTSTWGDITKAVVDSGGIRIRGFSETNYQAFKLLGFVGSAPDTTFSSAGRSACEIICGQMSGASVGAYGADSNVFSVRKQETGAAETTLWILDEDGDTWQSGYLNLESAGSVGIVITAGASQAANIVCKNDAQQWGFGCGGSDDWFVYDTTNSTYGIQVIPNPLHKLLLQTTYTALADGATNKHYWTNGVYFVNDSANANMTAGITINQGASDDEIMSFKSSDVAHGATHAVETDSYGRIKKAESDSGGLQIDGFKDSDGPTGALAIVMNGRIASNCDTAKSTSARAIIELKSAQTSGAADANIVADGNIFGVRGYTGGGFSTKLILDEDGDLWLTGLVNAGTATPVADMNVFKWSTTSTIRIVGDTGTGFDLQHAQTTAAAYVWLRDNAPMYLGTNNTTAMTITGDGEVTKPLQPAFQAVMTTDETNIASGGDTTLTWDGNPIFNIGSCFDETGDQNFTAPVTGKYRFEITIYFNDVDVDANWYSINIITSNKSYRNYFDPALLGGDTFHSVSMSILADMDASDTCYISVGQGPGGAAQTDIDGSYTYWSGNLVC